MEITQEEVEVSDRIVATARIKYCDKVRLLAKVTAYAPDPRDDGPFCGELLVASRFKKHVGNMLQWLSHNSWEKRAELKANGIRIDCCKHDAGGDSMHVLKEGDSDAGADAWVVKWGFSYCDPVADIPDRPVRLAGENSQEVMDKVVSSLKTLDRYIDLAARYMNIRKVVKTAELADSRERVKKSLHQLELLEKL